MKPEFGSVWYHLMGKDQSTARTHMTIAVPGATTQSMGLPDNNEDGWRLDHERRHVDGSLDGSWRISEPRTDFGSVPER